MAGDALLSYAFEFIATQSTVPAENLLKVVAALGRAVGAAGLVGGQVVDLESEGKADITVDTLNFIHRHKTAALLEVSVTAGAMLMGADAAVLEKLSSYAQNIGLAFQIVDDILDITSTQAELGKSIGKDVAAQKATFPSLWGLEESKRQAQQLVEQAKQDLESFDTRNQPLLAIADYITARTH